MKMKSKSYSLKFIVVLLFSSFISPKNSHADVRFDSSNANCVLKKFENGKWVFASISELDGKRFKNSKPTPNNPRIHAVMSGGKWYNADVNCFIDAAASSLQSTSSGNLANNGSSPSNSETSASTDAQVDGSLSGQSHDGSAGGGIFGFSHKYFLDSGLGFVFKRGTFGAAESSSLGSGVIATSPQSKIGTQIAIRLGLNLSSQLAGFFHFSHASLEQTTVFSGALTGNAKDTVSQIPLAFGVMYRLKTAGTFVPYLSGSLGVVFRKGEVKITDSSIAAYNGLIEYSGSGLYYSPEIGAEIRIHPAMYLTPFLRYEVSKITKSTVSSSSSSFNDKGDVNVEEISKFVLGGLGLRFNF